MLAQNDVKKALQIFAAKNKNEHQRLRSSSGGIFILLAEQTIKMGGVFLELGLIRIGKLNTVM